MEILEIKFNYGANYFKLWSIYFLIINFLVIIWAHGPKSNWKGNNKILFYKFIYETYFVIKNVKFI